MRQWQFKNLRGQKSLRIQQYWSLFPGSNYNKFEWFCILNRVIFNWLWFKNHHHQQRLGLLSYLKQKGTKGLWKARLVFYLCFAKVVKPVATFFQNFTEELITTAPLLSSFKIINQAFENGEEKKKKKEKICCFLTKSRKKIWRR